MTEVTELIDAVRREIGARTVDGSEARVLTVSRTFPTGLDGLWDACTNPERIPKWFLPVTGELRVGGRYQLQGNAGGTVERCTPPTGFAATWEFGGETSRIELRLATDPAGGTRFELSHIAHVSAERWAQFGPGALGVGWELGLRGLALHLASGEALNAAQEMTWPTSEEGKRFVELSSTGWGAASIAAGTPEAEATAAAARTTAFYTGT